VSNGAAQGISRASGPNGCTDCLNTGRDPQAFAGGIDEALNDAYAEGRKDQSEEDGELLRWAYSKLHHVSFTKQDDALMLDRFKLLLEHGVSA
jgi:hypothetical protein